MKRLGSNQSRMELKKKGSQDKKKQTNKTKPCVSEGTEKKHILPERSFGGKLVLGIHKTK